MQSTQDSQNNIVTIAVRMALLAGYTWHHADWHQTLQSTNPLFALCRHDDVELVGGVHWWCEVAGVPAVRSAHVRHHAVKLDVCRLLHGTEVVRQSGKESDSSWWRSRYAFAKIQFIRVYRL